MGLLCCALCVCNMFSTCKTLHEALAALLLLALPEGVQLEFPETLRKKTVKKEMGISAPQKSCLQPRMILPMGKMHHVYKTTPLCNREDGPTGYFVPPLAPSSFVIQTPLTDPAAQADGSGKRFIH